MQFEINQEVDYRGTCYKVARIEADGRVRIYIRRRNRFDPGVAVVTPDKLSVWVQPVKDRAGLMTCQICERQIMTGRRKSPAIAHHGYQRPEGWHAQTASCYGAMRKPFEHACDALTEHVGDVEVRRERFIARLQELRANPPGLEVAGPDETVRDEKGRPVYRGRHKLTRPTFKTAKDADFPKWLEKAMTKCATEIDQMAEYLKYQRERLANWKPA